MLKSKKKEEELMKQMQKINKDLVHYDDITAIYYMGLYKQIESASAYYPEFNIWYFQKVVPDLMLERRKIITETRDGHVAGIAIVKLSEELKLSTLKVNDNFQNRGVGLKLFERSFELLGSRKPFLTVSEDRLPLFQKIFKYYDFELTNVHEGIYRTGKKEFFFNEFSK